MYVCMLVFYPFLAHNEYRRSHGAALLGALTTLRDQQNIIVYLIYHTLVEQSE